MMCTQVAASHPLISAGVTQTAGCQYGRRMPCLNEQLIAVVVQARVQFHVLLTTYEMVVAESSELRRIQWQTLVVDEAHRLRRSTSRWCRMLCHLSPMG
jgi:SNF2-related domain